MSKDLVLGKIEFSQTLKDTPPPDPRNKILKIRDKVALNIKTDGEGNTYLIPLSKVEDFENCVETLEESSEGSDEWYDACSNFDDLYRGYLVEGELESITFYMNAKDFDEYE